MTVSANAATDPSQVDYPTSITFYDGVNNIGYVSCQGQQTCQGQLKWHATGLSGIHTLTARASTNRSLSATSAPTTVTVVSPSPAVTITHPSNGASLRGTITVAVSGATDSSQVDYPREIIVYDGTSDIGSVSCQGQQTCAGTVQWNTAGLKGVQVLRATIHTNTGREATSGPVYVGGHPSKPHAKVRCYLASLTVHTRHSDEGTCIASNVPVGTGVAIQYRTAGHGWRTATASHISRGGRYNFILRSPRPVSYTHLYVGVLPPKEENNGWKPWEQDPDTLDTWFSSALWTWSTLIDQDMAKDYDLSLEDLLKLSPDFKAYHPTNVMETGWDIIFFWVARMILTTTYVTGEIPFKDIYLHGMVRAEDGKKMSKSRPESIVDPLSVISKFGTDSLRMALIMGVSPGNDQNWGSGKVEANRNFCNKIWNIARYIESVTEIGDDKEVIPNTVADHWILNKLKITNDKIIFELDRYGFSEAYDSLYHFIWDDLADWYIEASKAEPNRALLGYRCV